MILPSAKHAYLIIAHNEFEILKVLLSMLDDERNDIYLHFDKKAGNINLLEFQTRKSRLVILDERIDVRWGDLSLTKVELLLFETAYNGGKYTYFHLLSGIDLPIQTQDYIHHFFDVNNGCEFVGYSSYAKLNRVLKYHLFTRYYKHDNIITRIIRRLCLFIQHCLHYQRKGDFTFYRGCNWVSITSDLVSVLLKRKKNILKRFRYTNCSDEFFVQSILKDSILKDNICNLEDEWIGCMRLIDWNRGEPYVWKNEDFQLLNNSEKLFARKFSSEDMEIVRRVQKEFSNRM